MNEIPDRLSMAFNLEQGGSPAPPHLCLGLALRLNEPALGQSGGLVERPLRRRSAAGAHRFSIAGRFFTTLGEVSFRWGASRQSIFVDVAAGARLHPEISLSRGLISSRTEHPE